jgi:hypothetical protein
MHLAVAGIPVTEGHYKPAVVRIDLVGDPEEDPEDDPDQDPGEPLLDMLGTPEHLRRAK